MLLWYNGNAQDLKQNVKGKITDGLTGKGLFGASVKIYRDNNENAATTDELGYFEVTNILPGRYRIVTSFQGYGSIDQELLVISGKESILEISLTESSTMLQEVKISSGLGADNQLPGLTTISIEKTMRVPANFFDPARMITTYPGVIAANDQGNAIIVKGNSPNGLLWRLNGIDIVNPNHLANAGTLSDKPLANGGGVNILSAQMLDRTNFYGGAFPTSYANALSGVFDMKFRKGNHDKTEYTAQASLIGLDVSAEGPIEKNHSTTFLTNYRYSTVGMLSKLGVNFGDEVIDFQDVSFNLNKEYKNGGNLSFFGLGGLSTNEFKEKKPSEWKEDKDHNNIRYSSQTFALGASYTIPVKRGSFAVGLGYSGTEQTRNMDASVLLSSTNPYLMNQKYDYSRGLLSNTIRLEHKLTDKMKWSIGSVTDLISDKLNSSQEIVTQGQSEIVNGSSMGILLQPYTDFDFVVTPKFDFNAGLRYVHFTYNNTQAFEPRLLVRYRPTAKQVFDFSYGLVSQTQLPAVYLAPMNKALGFSRAHHLHAGYHQFISESLKLNSELYFQKLFDVPIELSPSSTFSVINLLEGYSPGNLVNAGTGENYGINISVEKSFFKSYYFMLGGSYYESTYRGGDGIKRDTRFNGKYTVNATYGKEWSRQKKNSTIGLNTRMLYLGGLRETPVDVGSSQSSYETVYDMSKPFSVTLKDYFRIDLRLSFRKNHARYTRTFAIDLQNVTGQQNEAYHYYDFTKASVVTKYQLGIIPVLVYRFDF